MNIVIHVSGFPGSGKTTLGEKIKRIRNVIVIETDEFIQHHTKEGKQLLALEGENKWKEYKSLWKKTMKAKINTVLEQHKDKIIVFVGSLDNFALPGSIYNIKADHKFLLDVPLDELMKRYYLRVAKEKDNEDYWSKLSKGIYRISSSDNIIKNYAKYNKWHKKHNYSFLNWSKIIDYISSVKSTQI